MIRYLRQDEKGRSRLLWTEAFPEDSMQFVDYYYREKTIDNRILAAESEEDIVSMLHRNPYKITAGGRIWQCDYLVGVATAENSRRKGYMRKLMEQALADMRAEHMPFCFLMPAFEELYLPFGFRYIYRGQEWELNEKGSAALQKRAFTKTDSQAAAHWMNCWLERHYEVYALRSKAYLDRLEKELKSEDGCIELLYLDSALAGIQAEWGLSEREQRMLLCEPEYRQDIGSLKTGIMGRILDLQEFIKAVRLSGRAEERELTLVLEVRDRQLHENDGMWIWKLDRESSFMEKIHKKESGKMPDLVLDIGELTAWLMGYCVPGAAIKYAEKIRSLEGVFLDEVV